MPKEHRYWTYIVASLTGTLYIGMTNSLERRIRQHKEGTHEGFASKYGCNRLVYWESFDDVRKAIDREKELKGWRRERKIALIEAFNPGWQDLAEKWGWKMVFPGESMEEQK
jgi:putative endonuclease